MQVTQDIIDILMDWQNAPIKDIKRVKAYLMPDDDIERLKFKVTDHPSIDKNNRVYISWFDIDIIDVDTIDAINEKRYIGYIVIHCTSQLAYYYFNYGPEQ